MTFPDQRVLDLLREGSIEPLGRIAWSSNATFLVEVARQADPARDDGAVVAGEADPTDDAVEAAALRAIYKPERGERPLYDFPPGIFRREIAAFELARSLGWDVVPETVPVDGPMGPGSLQRFIDVDYEDHYFTMFEEGDEAVLAQLRRLCCFDLLANNTDRKAGHCLLDAARHVWAIDNALAFHAEFKLRTVIWDFAGTRIDAPLLDDISCLLDTGLADGLADLLDPFERDALLMRARAVLAEGVFPFDPTGRRYPWPLV
jgi:uncharacterized repeat protein (TIGR03843 family)